MANNDTIVFLKLVRGEILTDDELIYTDNISREYLLLLARGEKVNLESLLFDVCDMNHASCAGCPVRDLLPENEDCSCFKDGKAMLKFLRYKAK